MNKHFKLLLFCWILFGDWGCASNSETKADNELSTLSWQDSQKTVYIEPRTFNLHQIILEGHRPKILVRMATKNDASVNWPAFVTRGLAEAGTIGGLSAGLIILSPMAASAGFIGGAILVPPIIASSIHSSLDRSDAEKALKQVNLIVDIQKHLEASFDKKYPGQKNNDVVVEVILLDYGLYLPKQIIQVFSEYENMYFHCDAVIRVTQNDKVVFEDPIVWRAAKRSKDVPPPRYASLHQLSTENGLLIRDIFTEASEVIAAVTFKRLSFMSLK